MRPSASHHFFGPIFPEKEFNGWLANLELEIPHFHENAKSLKLSSAENDLVRQKILECEGTSGIQTIVLARGDLAEEDPQVNDYRDTPHADYDGTVLCKGVFMYPHSG